MKIDLNSLYSGINKEIIIDDWIEIPKEYYQKVDILDIKDLHVIGKIFLDINNVCNYTFKITGIMLIHDSVSYEEIDYPFNSEFDGKITENSKNMQNTIDIIPILWENIVLEVPLRFTKVNDISQIHGDGWKIITEEELNKNNPFNDLGKE